MKVCYFDSSALVKLLVDELESDVAADLWNKADAITSSRLSQPEVRAAISAARRNARLGPAAEQQAVTKWGEFWRNVDVIELSEPVASAAADLSSLYVLSGADAVHLASALAVLEGDAVLVAWDHRLRKAAVAAGLAVAPA